MRSFFLLLLVISFNSIEIYSQVTRADIENLMRVPRQYTILKTAEEIKVDGKDEEKAWDKAPWTEIFSDIVSGDATSSNKTRCKMLWNDEYLYLYAELGEQEIWASIKDHDASVFQDNAFEMFIDPVGSTHNYFEFQINAYSTVWDLFMSRPYRNGGTSLSSWDIKGLKKAVYLDGTLNKPGDKDGSWNVELAVPFRSLMMNRQGTPGIGTTWRMNFSHVQWDVDIIDGKYVRKRDAAGKLLPEHYSVWSPQGIVNLHYPERWGYVLFSDTLVSNFLSAETENLKLLLWKYYYLQQEFKRQYGKYANTFDQLNKMYPQIVDPKDQSATIEMEATDHQFWIQCFFPALNVNMSIDQDGLLSQKVSSLK